jgi:hypothetical protein
MAKLLLRLTSMILSFGMIVPYGAMATTTASGFDISNALSVQQKLKGLQCVPSSPMDQNSYATWLSNCQGIMKDLQTSSAKVQQSAKAFQAADTDAQKAQISANAALKKAEATRIAGNAQGGGQELAASSNAAMTEWNAAAGAKTAAETSANEAVQEFSAHVKAWNSQTPAPQQTIPENVTADLQKDAASMKADAAQETATAKTQGMNLEGILKTVGLLAAGAALGAGAMALFGNKKDDKKDEKNDDEDDDNEGEEETPPVAETCPANTVLENGVCVVKSEEDKCYDSNGNEDKTQVRNSDGKCVSINSLSACQTGYTENSKGECEKSGGTPNVGVPDPIVGAADASEDTQAAANKLNRSGTASTSSLGGGGPSATAPKSSGSSRGFSAGGGSGGGGASGGASAYSGGGGFSMNADKAEAGKGAEVQYQPLKWSNPKKEKSLRDTLKK